MKPDERSEIEDRIKELLASELNVSRQAITMRGADTPLLAGGIGLDSIETLALVVAVENEFDIQVGDSELTTRLFWNIGTLAEYVWQKLLEEKRRPEDFSS